MIDFGKAQFDKPTKFATAPTIEYGTFDFEGVSVETSSHLAFWEGEHSSDIAVADLSVVPDGGTANYRVGSMPSLPSSGGFSTLGDPHGIAVTAGVSNGKPVGVLVSSDRTWVARVDLQALLAPDSFDAGVHTSNVLSAEKVRAAVTYLDARHSPGAADGGI